MLPTGRLFACLAAWAALGLAASLWRPAEAWWLIAGGAIALAALLDGWAGRRAPPLRVERQAPGVLPLGAVRPVTLQVHNTGTRAASIDLFDTYPTAWEMDGLPHTVPVQAGGFAAVTYRVRAHERGDAAFGTAWLRVPSPFGLWRVTHRLGGAHEVRVFPDFAAILGQTLRGADRNAPTAGSLIKRQRGEGTEFRQLREYRRGDSLRSIDWKATARHRKPISREYQSERDQQVVFLLDSGRRMLAQDGATSHFDHALNAVLTLSFVAARQGDAVGLMSFGAATRWVPPGKGTAGVDRVLAGVYDLQPTETAPDFPRAAQELLGRLSKRAFIVLITNLRDEDDRALRSGCELLSERHLVLCASLRERALDAVGQQDVVGFEDALRAAGTEIYLRQRREAIRQLGLPRDRLIDVAPSFSRSRKAARYNHGPGAPLALIGRPARTGRRARPVRPVRLSTSGRSPGRPGWQWRPRCRRTPE
jgi:uncharacterized protein (DUF58 family)